MDTDPPPKQEPPDASPYSPKPHLASVTVNCTTSWVINTPRDQHFGPGKTPDLSLLPELQNAIGGGEQLLLKLSKYQSQAEYRLLWNVDKLDVPHIFVNAPQAVQFCRRISAAELALRE
jgi:hypothetical protein